MVQLGEGAGLKMITKALICLLACIAASRVEGAQTVVAPNGCASTIKHASESERVQMAGFFKRVLGMASPVATPASQAETVAETPPSGPVDPKEWQRHWHRVFDEYPHPETDPPGVPDPLPEMDDDNRLIYGFWHIPAEARTKALAPLPRGDAIAERANAFMSTKRVALSEDEAMTIARRGLSVLRDVGLDGPSPDAPIKTILIKTWPPDFLRGQPLTDFRQELREWVQQAGEANMEAWFFLGEPFYESSSSFEVANWMAWPLSARPGAPDPTEAGYRLWKGGWMLGRDDEDALILLDMRDYLELAGRR